MTAGTVEGLTTAMQAWNRELLEWWLNENRAANPKVPPEDLGGLFAPLATAAEP
jgi:hypothetical protein